MRLIDLEMDHSDDQSRDGDKKQKKTKKTAATDKDKDKDNKEIKSDLEMKKMLEKQDSFSAFLSENLATTVQDTKQRKEVTHHEPAARQSTTSTGKKPRVLENTREVEDENLGEDFEQTPWLPPMIEKAKDFKRKAIYHGGEVRLDGISLADAPDLGAGVSLYFLFAKVMAVCFFVMVRDDAMT